MAPVLAVARLACGYLKCCNPGVPGRRRKCVKKPKLPYQMHRDVNAAWNLWEVCLAQYLGHPRPRYLRADTAA
eukprot:1150925-Pelagomonas_calceolata.AAC.1